MFQRMAAEGFACASLVFKKRSVMVAIAKVLLLVMRHRETAIFHAHLDASTLLLCFLRRIINFKLVVSVYAIPAQWPRWYTAVFRRCISAADHVIVSDRIALQEVHDCGVAPNQISYIPLGTQLLDGPLPETTEDIRSSLGIDKSMKICLNIARMVAGKGQAQLIEAMKYLEHTDVVAIIVGYGPEEKHLKELAERLKLEGKVFFAGRRTDLHNFYSSANLFIMPCLDESMGVVIYEALSYSIPVISYDSGSIREVIQDGINGYVIEAEARSLAEKIEQVIVQAPTLDFSSNDQYSARTMALRHSQVYTSLATGRRTDNEPAEK